MSYPLNGFDDVAVVHALLPNLLSGAFDAPVAFATLWTHRTLTFQARPMGVQLANVVKVLSAAGDRSGHGRAWSRHFCLVFFFPERQNDNGFSGYKCFVQPSLKSANNSMEHLTHHPYSQRLMAGDVVDVPVPCGAVRTFKLTFVTRTMTSPRVIAGEVLSAALVSLPNRIVVFVLQAHYNWRRRTLNSSRFVGHPKRFVEASLEMYDYLLLDDFRMASCCDF